MSSVTSEVSTVSVVSVGVDATGSVFTNFLVGLVVVFSLVVSVGAVGVSSAGVTFGMTGSIISPDHSSPGCSEGSSIASPEGSSIVVLVGVSVLASSA